MDNIQRVFSAIARQDKMAMVDANAKFWEDTEKELKFENEVKELRVALKSVIGGDSIHGIDY